MAGKILYNETGETFQDFCLEKPFPMFVFLGAIQIR